MKWTFKCAYQKTISKICQDSYGNYNIELEEQRKLELMLKAEQNKVKEIAAKEAKNQRSKMINEITQKSPLKKKASQLLMKPLTKAIRSCRNASYKTLYVKMFYKELNQKLHWG